MPVMLKGFAKSNHKLSPYCVPNEVVCAELARTLGLPVPAYTIANVGKRAFVSVDFNHGGQRWPTAIPAQCVTLLPKLCTGVVLFDILVVNTDRHPTNLALLDASGAPRLAIFDHDRALFGHVRDKGVERLAFAAGRIAVDKAPFAGHDTDKAQCLMDPLPDDRHFDDWLGRIEAIPDFLIDDLAARAVDLGCTQAEGTALREFLKTRRRELRSLVKPYRDCLTAPWRELKPVYEVRLGDAAFSQVEGVGMLIPGGLAGDCRWAIDPTAIARGN